MLRKLLLYRLLADTPSFPHNILFALYLLLIHLIIVLNIIEGGDHEL